MPGSVENSRVHLAARLRDHRSGIEQATMTRVFGVSDPTGVIEPGYLDGLRAAVRAAIEYAITALEHGGVRSSPIPAALLAQARLAARSGVGLEIVLRRYMAGYVLLGDFLRAEAQRYTQVPTIGELLPERAEVLDHLLIAVSEEYKRESNGRTHPQSALNGSATRIERLLDADSPVDMGQLSYDFDAFHTGASIQGLESIESVRELAASLDQQLLILKRENSKVWAWLGSRHGIDLDELENRIVATVPADATIGLGELAEGLRGWRLTRRQANAALSVALRKPQRVARYIDVAPEAAALHDEVLAGSWIETYLLPLDDLSMGGQMARKTLRALLDREHNVSSAAHMLGIHRSTVHRWRNEIEERLGCRLCENQTGIEIALRVEDLHYSPDRLAKCDRVTPAT